MNIGIIGLGLMGGSFAKSTKARTLHDVYGIDINDETMMLARLAGAIDAPLDANNIADCDLLLLAVLPHTAIEWLRAHAPAIAPETTVVDLCGVKRTVCEQLEPLATEYGFTYVGGHPMAGSERAGFVNASDNFFAAASMILTPSGHVDIGTLEVLKNYFLDVGFASLTFTTPEEHDRIIAYTSQLAHITASAYVRSPEALERRGFSAGSFRDMTRVARLDEEMWTELLLDNSDHLLEQLDIFIAHLNEFRESLQARDESGLKALLKEGREIKAQVGEN